MLIFVDFKIQGHTGCVRSITTVENVVFSLGYDHTVRAWLHDGKQSVAKLEEIFGGLLLIDKLINQ